MPTMKHFTKTYISNMFVTTLNSTQKHIITDYNNASTWQTNYSTLKTIHKD